MDRLMGLKIKRKFKYSHIDHAINYYVKKK